MIPNIEVPKGFRAAGVHSGVRRYRPDLGIIFSETNCSAAGVFTQNAFKAAPVLYNMRLLPSDSIRAIVVNSGHANAATGDAGVQDNLIFASKAAEVMGIEQSSMLACSTGIIGERIPLELLMSGLETVPRHLSENINSFALAIMTTDLVPKFHTLKVEIGGKEITLTGASKGSGMIHPNMATMLAFVCTDVGIEANDLQSLLREVSDRSFNMISVDSETSTNDSVIVLANGASGVRLSSNEDKKLFAAALEEICVSLAKQIARDGEGATKLITFEVRGARTLEEARRAARDLSTSPLIKSAIHGEDPNWGRILSRLGSAGVAAEALQQLSVHLQGLCVFAQSVPQAFDRSEAKALLRSPEIYILVDLKTGAHHATAWGCDLTKRYVEINTEYS